MINPGSQGSRADAEGRSPRVVLGRQALAAVALVVLLVAAARCAFLLMHSGILAGVLLAALSVLTVGGGLFCTWLWQRLGSWPLRLALVVWGTGIGLCWLYAQTQWRWGAEIHTLCHAEDGGRCPAAPFDGVCRTIDPLDHLDPAQTCQNRHRSPCGALEAVRALRSASGTSDRCNVERHRVALERVPVPQ